MVLLINSIPVFLITVPQSQSHSHPKALDLAITSGLKGSQTHYAAPPPTTWIEGKRTCWRLPPDLESPHAPHLEADIAPFAAQTGEEEEDEGQQARAGNEDHGIGRSQRGPAQGESICGHRTGLGSRLARPWLPDSLPLPVQLVFTTTPMMLCNQGPLAEEPDGPGHCGSCSLGPSQVFGLGVGSLLSPQAVTPPHHLTPRLG